MRFLIAGSSGFLGTRLSEQLSSLGHEVTPLVRRPAESDEVTWDPYRKPLDPEVVDRHDVVVNVAGSPTVGNPHSKKWADSLMNSRVTTTRVLAEAIAASDSQPTFLAGNGIGIYGDHGSQPVTEMTDSRGDALLTRVSREWKAATEPARAAGARVCVLHTAPIHDQRSEPLRVLRLLFKAGLGGPIGDGSQHVPMISARDWVDSVIHLAETDSARGSFNLCCERAPTNEELTRELARLVHRPAFCRVPAFVVRRAAGAMSNEVLGSVNCVPARLQESGYSFADPDVRAVLREGLDPSR